MLKEALEEMKQRTTGTALYDGFGNKFKTFTPEKIAELSKRLEVYAEKRNCWGRRQSAFMDLNMVLQKESPTANAKQCLAHIERSFDAAKETEYKIRLQRIDLQEKQERALLLEADTYEARRLAVEIEKGLWQIDRTAAYFEGALKTISTYLRAYEEICEAHKIEAFDERDYEEQQEEHHIKTCLKQSLRDIRQTGTIGAGNQEYCENCGLDPLSIQLVLVGWLEKQRQEINNGHHQNCSSGSMMAFLHELYLKLRGSATRSALRYGIESLYDTEALYRGINGGI